MDVTERSKVAVLNLFRLTDHLANLLSFRGPPQEIVPLAVTGVISLIVLLYNLYCIVLHCIVYIYIALLAVHSIQKRFQYERPRENDSTSAYYLFHATIWLLSSA